MTERRRAHRPLVLHDAERQARNEAYTADVRARGDYHPPTEEEKALWELTSKRSPT